MTGAGAEYVGRGGTKLEHGLRELGVSPAGLACADFGCSTGGFTDCLLRHGARRVYAVDTAYGVLAWTLRNDPRVVVLERTNCLHAAPPAELADAGGADLVVIDASWTPQRLVVPAALRWLRANGAGRIVSLVKPHYEAKALGVELPRGGVLDEATALGVAERVRDEVLPALGVRVLGMVRSPVLGGAGKKRAGSKGGEGTGNAEYLVLLAREGGDQG